MATITGKRKLNRGRRRQPTALQKEIKKEAAKVYDRRIRRQADKKYKVDDFQLFSGTTGSVVRLSGVVQGDGETERIGLNVRFTEFVARMSIETADSPSNQVRVIFFLWHLESSPTVGQVLETAAQPLNPHLASHRTANGVQFTILSDRVHIIDDDDPTLYSKYTKRWKGMGLPVTYSGTGLNSLAIKNDLYALVITDSAVLPHPTFNLAYKILYMDV